MNKSANNHSSHPVSVCFSSVAQQLKPEKGGTLSVTINKHIKAIHGGIARNSLCLFFNCDTLLTLSPH